MNIANYENRISRLKNKDPREEVGCLPQTKWLVMGRSSSDISKAHVFMVRHNCCWLWARRIHSPQTWGLLPPTQTLDLVCSIWPCGQKKKARFWASLILLEKAWPFSQSLCLLLSHGFSVSLYLPHKLPSTLPFFQPRRKGLHFCLGYVDRLLFSRLGLHVALLPGSLNTLAAIFSSLGRVCAPCCSDTLLVSRKSWTKSCSCGSRAFSCNTWNWPPHRR